MKLRSIVTVILCVVFFPMLYNVLFTIFNKLQILPFNNLFDVSGNISTDTNNMKNVLLAVLLQSVLLILPLVSIIIGGISGFFLYDSKHRLVITFSIIAPWLIVFNQGLLHIENIISYILCITLSLVSMMLASKYHNYTIQGVSNNPVTYQKPR